MKQMLDTISTLPPVFPLNHAGYNFGRPDRRPANTLQARNARLPLRSAGSSSAGRSAAARIANSAETYVESSMAHCSFPPAPQTEAPGRR
jgi:hypothetical protein